jgi:hypothetical protein
MAAATKKEEANSWKAGTSSGHITNLKQSILETFDIYGYNSLFYKLLLFCLAAKASNISSLRFFKTFYSFISVCYNL